MSDGIHIINERDYDIDAASLIRAAAMTLEQRSQQGELSIVIHDAAAVAELNRQHRGIDALTDALSFPAAKLPDEIAGETAYLGDIVIARDYTAAQARKNGVDVDDALCLLVVHATLHLLGYEHDTRAARDEMWAAQAEAMNALGLDSDLAAQYGGGDE